MTPPHDDRVDENPEPQADENPEPQADENPEPQADETPEPQRRSLDTRWWWQAAVLIIAGAAIIGFQWNVITGEQAIAATWVMVAIGVVLIGYGAVVAWRTHPSRAARGEPTEPPTS